MDEKLCATSEFSERFLSSLEAVDYIRTPAVRVSSGDSSVSFVNATVTPFKRAMEADLDLRFLCHVQPCIRAHGHHPWLYTFDMVGVISRRSDAHRVVRDSIRSLLESGSWIDARSVTAAVDPRDDDVEILMSNSGIRVWSAPDRPEDTRWRYGDDCSLSGRGCTLYAPALGAVSCGPDCVAGCECGRWVQIGNVILIESPGAGYVEVAFGVESVRGLAYGGDLYGIPEISRSCRRLEGLGYSQVAARNLVNLERVLARLDSDGVGTTGRGPGHVMRRFVGAAFDLVADGTPVESKNWQDRVRRVDVLASVTRLLMVEGERRRKVREGSLRAAEKHAKRRATKGSSVSWKDLRATFGISRSDALDVLSRVTHG